MLSKWLAVLPATAAFVIQSSPGTHFDTSTPANCTVWATTQPGDTCNGIEWYFNITQTEFASWNPSLKNDCSGLSLNNYSYCAQIKQPPSSDDYTYTLPNPTSTATDSEDAYSPVQTGISSNCDSYFYVAKNETCQGIVDYYDGLFSLEDFYSWNPAVQKDCSQLFAGYFVCVGLTSSPTQLPATNTASPTATGPSPEQTGLTSDCDDFYLVQSGDTCQAISDKNGIKLQDFYTWNPAVESDCSHLYLGYYVCVGVPGYVYATTTTSAVTSKPTTTGNAAPSPTQSGIAANCNHYYQAVSGDSCYAIATQNGTFSVAQFEQWNPAVGSDCSMLWATYYYCTGVSGSSK
ncbi:uncharacterized protein RCC_10102 [Ramularia collo-cygni]|uniref:LysM domain-containing protein n=1 Tax=Ramularia collo-cygni TaxID=112498 RepID=A0A2D3V240_9PEZI|nr:uncharacterized protein RCC_10102 [Ramularia collo-cygni]CZT24377.1 uncharacterized protein RCC_10102 [Ramularia collo-cygni]